MKLTLAWRQLFHQRARLLAAIAGIVFAESLDEAVHCFEIRRFRTVDVGKGLWMGRQQVESGHESGQESRN